MNFTVPVNFTVAAESAEQAHQIMTDRLHESQLLYMYSVQEAQCQDINDVVISDELTSQMCNWIQNNDFDSTGYETDLNYCVDSSDWLYYFVNNDSISQSLLDELDSLVNKFGGTTSVGTLLDKRRK